MPDMPEIASIAALLGDPTRSRMLTALMAGQAQTATELALAGGVMPSTASIHLARLRGAGLVATVKQGRHRYFRIASPEVAAAIEGLMTIAPVSGPHSLRPGPRDLRLRRARVCYDHLAGEVAVRLLDRLRARRMVAGDGEELALTRGGEQWCERIGVDLVALRTRRRLCRSCLDWSERRTHLGGAVGCALLERLFRLRLARREEDSRVVVLSPRGEAFVESLEVSR